MLNICKTVLVPVKSRLPLIIVCLFFSNLGLAGASASTVNQDEQEIQIQASKIRIRDEVTYTPHSVVIEQPASDVYLGETLSKLPGVLVRNVSGFGSVTTVITSQALGSGGTAVSIDDIPVVEPTGQGVNFSLFPSPLINSIEHHSPFYPSLDPTADTLPAPGGRINLRTLKPLKKGESPFLGSILFGTGNTVEGSGAYRFGNEKQDGIVGLTGFNIEGNFHYHNPSTDQGEDRANNSAAGFGALAKYRWHLKNKTTVEVLDLFSNSGRTNPGSLDFPSRDSQRDTFNLLGARVNAPKLISDRDGLFAKLAGAFSRTGTRTSPPVFSVGADSTDTRSLGGYTQAGYVRTDEASSFTFALDNQHDYLRGDNGLFTRNVFGATATFSVDVGKFRIVPLGRQEASSQFPSAGDGAVSVMYLADAENDFTLSYGLSHVYPSITAASGFRNSGFTLIPNTALSVQRDSIGQLTYNRRGEFYTLHSSAFYDLIRNRATFSSLTNTTAQFVNVPSVSVWGGVLDAQVFPTEQLSFRGSLTVQRAWNQATGHEMPYKPRVEGWGAVSYLVLPWIGFTVQEQFIGKRFVSERDLRTISPIAQTIFRLDAQLLGGTAFFKIANVFDRGGFENPGFPIPGRSYWIGYTYK